MDFSQEKNKDNPVPSMTIVEATKAIMKEFNETGDLSYGGVHDAIVATHSNGVETNKVQPMKTKCMCDEPICKCSFF